MTIRTFKDGLNALSIAGVNRRVDEINRDVNVADLPFQYCELPQTGSDFMTFTRLDINPIRTVDLVVIVRPIVMATNEENHDDLIDLADNVVTALAGSISNVHIDSYSLALEPRTIGGTDYHAVVATVTGRDK